MVISVYSKFVGSSLGEITHINKGREVCTVADISKEIIRAFALNNILSPKMGRNTRLIALNWAVDNAQNLEHYSTIKEEGHITIMCS